MPMIIPPGYGLCRYLLTLDGDPETMMTTCGHDLSDAGGDFESAALQLSNRFGGLLMEQFSGAYTFRGVQLTVGTDGGDPITYEVTTANTGGLGNDAPPQNTAVLVQKRTALGGRRNRGRMYLPGFTVETQVTSRGTLDGAALTAKQEVINEWAAALTTPGGGLISMPPVILHSEVPAGPTPITEFRVSGVVATQRRRLRR